jgi:multimeric flavodoxin WrbA
MTLLIHDVEDIGSFLKNKPVDMIVISDNGKIKPCSCCFGCWIKTPVQCVIKDGYENMGELLSKSSRVNIISKCFYGGFSPFIKNVIEKSISYALPYFQIINGEVHHKARYSNTFDFVVHFYGEITEPEKETAKRLIKAGGIDIHQKTEVYFYESPAEIKGVF